MSVLISYTRLTEYCLYIFNQLPFQIHADTFFELNMYALTVFSGLWFKPILRSMCYRNRKYSGYYTPG